MTGTCAVCRAPIHTDAYGIVHDAPLAELRVSMTEYNAVMADKMEFENQKPKRPFDKIHEARFGE